MQQEQAPRTNFRMFTRSSREIKSTTTVTQNSANMSDTCVCCSRELAFKPVASTESSAFKTCAVSTPPAPTAESELLEAAASVTAVDGGKMSSLLQEASAWEKGWHETCEQADRNIAFPLDPSVPPLHIHPVCNSPYHPHAYTHVQHHGIRKERREFLCDACVILRRSHVHVEEKILVCPIEHESGHEGDGEQQGDASAEEGAHENDVENLSVALVDEELRTMVETVQLLLGHAAGEAAVGSTVAVFAALRVRMTAATGVREIKAMHPTTAPQPTVLPCICGGIRDQ
jgi:hypothetical protein